ncbi:MAG: TetR/AcrR family transcriptional regulator [Alphaproteobacteria bacterium]|nr:TetR/AcrR family transcriptional regulator [Alphaproteobacteria bacterium]
MAPREPSVAREKILEAAMHLVRSQGVAKLTLDGAAREAGLSKGGVLYHFPSKSALVRAMVARVIEQWEKLHQSYFEQEPEGPHRWMRAAVHAFFDTDSPCCKDPLGTALLAGLAHDPDLIAPLRVKYREWMEQSMMNAPSPGLMGVIGLMGDGLVLHQLIGLDVLDEKSRDCIKAAALDLMK